MQSLSLHSLKRNLTFASAGVFILVAVLVLAFVLSSADPHNIWCGALVLYMWRIGAILWSTAFVLGLFRAKPGTPTQFPLFWLLIIALFMGIITHGCVEAFAAGFFTDHFGPCGGALR